MRWLGTFFDLSTKRFVVTLVVFSQLFAVRGYSENPKLPPELDGIDLKKVQAHRLVPISDYFDADFKVEKKEGALDADVKIFIKHAQQLGVFPKDAAFLEWWTANKEKFMKPAALKKMKALTLAEFTTKMFLVFTAEEAVAMDAADPENVKKKEKGELTEGDQHFLNRVHGMDLNGYSVMLIAAAGAFAYGVVRKLVDVFFHGPVAQIMNTALEPAVRPVREKVDLWINTHLAPKLVPWAQWVLGEGRRRARAKKEADRLAAGGAATLSKAMEAASSAMKRYAHPAISVEAFANDTEIFYKEMLKADYAWRGWIAPELARARTTGFELLFHQYRLIGEQLTGYQTTANVNQILQASINRPAMIEAGATPSELREFQELIRKIHELVVYKDLRHADIPALEAGVTKILQKWADRKIPERVVNAFHQTEKETLISEDRPAFLLASVLDGERYFQENTLALAPYPTIQAWQEQAREMMGYYEELAKHREKIQMYFDRRGLAYDVQKRIDERGHPLGGPFRPESLPAVKDCVREFYKMQAAPPPPAN